MLLTTTRTESSDLWKICAISAAVLAPFFIYFATVRSIVGIWNSSDTFAHGYIILPMSLWMIWKRRDILPIEAAAPYWPALLPLAACGFGWFLADLAAVQVVQQYAFVAMIPLIVLAMLGPRLTQAMAFPLLFLLLAVPFGDAFIGPLINFTADFTVAALQATGIPVLRNGTHFEIPSGSWSVVEACSGVRYLISSVTLGCLYAYLTYRSRVRQAVFILLSIVVPILANGLRAYMIVMIGHVSGMKLAVGVDHLIYGWLFFGLVMFVMIWIGSFWREDLNEIATTASARILRMPGQPAPAKHTLTTAFAVLLCLAVWPIYSNYIDRAVFNPETADLSRFKPDWQEVPPFTTWKPRFFPANAEFHQFFQHDERAIGVSILYYRNQDAGTKLISSSNRLVLDNDPLWRVVGTSVRHESFSNRSLILRESRIQGPSGPMVVWYWYWVDGKYTVNDYVAKLLQAKEKFLIQGDDGAALMLFAPYSTNPDEARVVLRNFLSANLQLLEETLVHGKRR